MESSDKIIWCLKLSEYKGETRGYVYFSCLEEIPFSGWYGIAEKGRYAKEFNSCQEAEEYRIE